MSTEIMGARGNFGVRKEVIEDFHEALPMGVCDDIELHAVNLFLATNPDQQTQDHTFRVADTAVDIVYELLARNQEQIRAGQTPSTVFRDRHDVKFMAVAAILHDIGKIGMSSVTNSPNALGWYERMVINEHVVRGYMMIRNLGIGYVPEFQGSANGLENKTEERLAIAALYHHRNGGNPSAKRLEELEKGPWKLDRELLESEVNTDFCDALAAADSFDALTSGRAYTKNRLTAERGRSYVRSYDEVLEITSGNLRFAKPEILDALRAVGLRSYERNKAQLLDRVLDRKQQKRKLFHSVSPQSREGDMFDRLLAESALRGGIAGAFPAMDNLDIENFESFQRGIIACRQNY